MQAALVAWPLQRVQAGLERRWGPGLGDEDTPPRAAGAETAAETNK